MICATQLFDGFTDLGYRAHAGNFTVRMLRRQAANQDRGVGGGLILSKRRKGDCAEEQCAEEVMVFHKVRGGIRN